MGKKWKQRQILFSWAPESLWTVTAAMKLKDSYSWKESYDKPRQHIKKGKTSLYQQVPHSQGYGLSSSHIQI